MACVINSAGWQVTVNLALALLNLFGALVLIAVILFVGRLIFDKARQMARDVQKLKDQAQNSDRDNQA